MEGIKTPFIPSRHINFGNCERIAQKGTEGLEVCMNCPLGKKRIFKGKFFCNVMTYAIQKWRRRFRILNDWQNYRRTTDLGLEAQEVPGFRPEYGISVQDGFEEVDPGLIREKKIEEAISLNLANMPSDCPLISGDNLPSEGSIGWANDI
jgi:hypothetical protein